MGAKVYKSETDKIYINCLSNFQQLIFPAFITSFQDVRNSSWANTVIYGKNDPVFTFKNTTRKLSLAFDIVSPILGEARTTFSNLKILKSSLYPVYQVFNSQTHRGAVIPDINYALSTPPTHVIKYANLISNIQGSNFMIGGLMGWIDSLDFKPELDSGYFMENNNLYPKLYKLKFNFNVIHDYPLGFRMKGYEVLPRAYNEEFDYEGFEQEILQNAMDDEDIPPGASGE